MGIARSRGQAAESMAAAYLALIGCEVLARNVRRCGVEIDALVKDGSARVIVEVRYRSRDDFGAAAETVGPDKRIRLLQAARALEVEHRGPVRIDVIAIDLAAGGATLRHYRNAVA